MRGARYCAALVDDETSHRVNAHRGSLAMFARMNAIGAVLVVGTLLAPVTSVSAFAATANTDGTAALSVFTGQGDAGTGWIGNADGEGGPSNVSAPSMARQF